MLTLAQITDLHITTDRDPENHVRNEQRLRCVLEAIHDRKPRPDAIIVSGDLVDNGALEEYLELKKIFAAVTVPLYLGMGNHDLRAPFRQVFPDTPVDPHGFVQYAVDLKGVRLIMLDTLETKTEAGFCHKRAAWLRRTLGQEQHTPTIVALHHPPVASGIHWMDPDPDAAWIARLSESLKNRRQVLTAITGHVHRPYFGTFAGHTFSVSPATSVQLTLNLTPIDRQVPDGRHILIEEPPGYTLLMWNKGALCTHFCVAGDFAPAAHFRRPLEDA